MKQVWFWAITWRSAFLKNAVFRLQGLTQHLSAPTVETGIIFSHVIAPHCRRDAHVCFPSFLKSVIPKDNLAFISLPSMLLFYL